MRIQRSGPTRFVRRTTLVAFAVALLCACSGSEEVDHAVELDVVAVEPILAIDFIERITATGELRATNHANIAAEVDGRVTELLVEEGAAVPEGGAILELDPVRRELDLAAARARNAEADANLHNERRDVKRRRELRANDISSKAALDKAETLLRLAESRVAGARADIGIAERALAEATVRAPFSGHLVMRNVSLGEYVKQGTPLVELVSLDPIEVVFNVSEVDSSRVHTGQEVRVAVAPYPGEFFEAVVDSVSPTIDPRSRTLRVKAKLANSEGRLRPGLFARADLGVAQRKGVPVVPDQSVLQRTDGSVVFTLSPDDMRVHRRVIKASGFRDGYVEIADGVAPGELVLTKGHSTLVDGQVVRLPKALIVELPSEVAAKPGEAEEGAAEVTLQ